jgi:hypothetical protein
MLVTYDARLTNYLKETGISKFWNTASVHGTGLCTYSDKAQEGLTHPNLHLIKSLNEQFFLFTMLHWNILYQHLLQSNIFP